MQITNFLQPNQQLGFVIIITLVMFSVLIYIIKKGERRQEINEIRYEKLVDKLFEIINKMSDKQEKSYKELAEQLNVITTELRLIGMRIDKNTNVIDKELEVRNKFIVFPKDLQDKDNKDRFL